MRLPILSTRFAFFTLVGALRFCDLSAQYSLPFDSLEKLLVEARADSTQVKLLFELGRENWFARNFNEATEYLQQSVSLAERSGYLKRQADAYNLLGNVYLKQEAFDTAFNCLEKALEVNDRKFTPLIHGTYSNLYFHLGDYQLSLDFALKSAEGFEADPDPMFNIQSVFAYLTVGDILSKLSRTESALSYYKKAYEKARHSDKNWFLKTPLQKIADSYLAKNELDKARHLYDTIIAIDRDAPSFEPTMHSYEGLGNIAMKEGAYKKAIQYYKQSLQYALQKGLSANVENFYTRMGSAFLADRQTDSARWYLQRAIANSSKSRNFNNISQAYQVMALMHQQSQNFNEALNAFQLHKAYSDSILTVEKIRSINNLEVLYRTRQHENEILRLQKTQQDKDFAIKNRNISIFIGLGVVVGMGVILFLLIKTYRHRQRMQEEQVKELDRQHQIASLQLVINGQEAERSRIARDLHDGLGGLFSTVKMYFSTLEHEHSSLKENELFKKSYSLVDSASVEIRRIAHNMMPEVLIKMGLINAVKDLADNISAGRLLNVSLETHGMSKRLDAHTEIMLYRIVQELFNNIIKHAQAREVIVQFIRDGNRLSVVVEDDGCGFDPEEPADRIHVGIETIKSRVAYLNGKFTIDSQTGIGTTVMMDFLLNERE